ncbi:acyl carrier protein [Cohnella yongneupensis]|uniref:Acyl carrier protein n=1 Tax=Cohnella yongneupensis TaxID=425006 RepID=A0ABW0R598_9BACL
MKLDEICSILTDHIMKQFQIESDDDEFTPDVHLFDYGYIDSFGATELTSFVESRFEIEVTKKDLMLHKMNTINEIAAFVAMKRGN